MLNEIEQLEKDLAFESFSSKTALRIGSYLSQMAIEQNLPLVVDISLYNRCLYHFCAEGTTRNTEYWVERKKNTVDFFGHSTLWVKTKVGGDAMLLVSKYGLESSNTTIVEGGFPILLKESGMIGTICISGLEPATDHRLVVEALLHERKRNMADHA